MASGHPTSLQRLQDVEKSIVHAVELAGGVMEELANPNGPRSDVIGNHCKEFMQCVKYIQVTLREEIKGMCEYRPYENSAYVARTSSEISVKKLSNLLSQVENMQDTMRRYKEVHLPMPP